MFSFCEVMVNLRSERFTGLKVNGSWIYSVQNCLEEFIVEFPIVIVDRKTFEDDLSRTRMEKQNENFTKKMLSERVFTCTICEHLLMVPVMMIENVGNVCDKCFRSRNVEKGKSLPNTKLDTILQELKFPCKFETEGCDVEVIYGDLKDHEEKCIFRTVECVMPKSDCEWKGKLVDLLKHFKEEHAKHVITSPYGIFSFENTIAKSANVVKLLSNKNKTYILKITEDEDGKSLQHFILDIKSNPEDEELVVKYVGKTDQHKLKVKRLSFNSLHYQHTAKKIKLSTLREIAAASENIMATIKPAKCIFKNMNDEILKQLECLVCKELMRPPIHLCNTGHSLCSSCRQKLKVVQCLKILRFTNARWL
ncbi:E3 ubiquitin-protein ligase sina-like isoform X2 [Tenebrio molitor]|uniref:E3 ubiquitin-protein ligase sina-like isoform X2 n=1 Tax=Tenebrio molitor TaxID=7067 RepID=UPI00362489F5